MTTDELNILVRLNGSQQFRSQMHGCTTSTLAFKAAIAGITLATKKFISSALELASNLEEVQNVVDVTFGSMTETVNKFSKAAMQNYGLSETIAKKYTGIYGSMAKQFGFTTEEALKMSTTLTAMTGDAASFYNYEPDQVYTKLKSVFTGETESLKEIGVVMTQTALDQYALEKGIGKTTKQMSEQEKVALRYMYVMEQLGSVSGDYQRTNDGWANSFRTAKLQLQSMVAEVGAELMPVAKTALSYTMRGLQIVLGFLKSTATGIHYVTQGWAIASKSTKVLIAVATGAAIAFLNLNKIVAVTNVLVKLLSTNIFSLQGVLMLISMIAGAVGAVKLISSISDVFDKVEASMKKTTDTAFNMNTGFDDGTESVEDLADSVKELEKSLMSFDEVNKINDNKSLLGDIVSDDAMENFKEFNNMLDGMYDNLSFDAFEGLGSIFDTVNSKMNEFFGGFMDKIRTTKKLWEELINAKTFEEKLGKAEEILHEWFPNWTKFWDECGAAMYDIWHEKNWKKKIEALEKFIHNQFSGSTWATLWSNSWGVVMDCFKIAYDLITGDTASLKLDLLDLLSTLSNIYNFWKSIITGDTVGKWSSIIQMGINSANKSGLNKNSTPKMKIVAGPTLTPGVAGWVAPAYAAGGFPDMGEMFVARENGPEMVGKIGNKTAVANNEQITTALYNAVKSALGGNNNRGGTTVLYIDGKVLGKATVDYINNQTMSSGQSPLVEIG